MPASYIVRLPDGVEYGPADLPTLAGWHKEGRLPAGSQVQAEEATTGGPWPRCSASRRPLVLPPRPVELR